MATVFFAASPDVFVFEIHGGILVRFFKKCSEHIHVQRFAESARSREKRDHRTLIKKILNHHGLVNIIVFG